MKIVHYQSVQADRQSLPQEFQSLISDPYGVSNLLYCLLFKGPIDKKRQRKSQDQRLDLGINPPSRPKDKAQSDLATEAYSPVRWEANR